MKKQTGTKPKPKRDRIVIYLPPKVARWLRTGAKEDGRTVSEQARRIFAELIEAKVESEK